jgi:hypothetical protein
MVNQVRPFQFSGLGMILLHQPTHTKTSKTHATSQNANQLKVLSRWQTTCVNNCLLVPGVSVIRICGAWASLGILIPLKVGFDKGKIIPSLSRSSMISHSRFRKNSTKPIACLYSIITLHGRFKTHRPLRPGLNPTPRAESMLRHIDATVAS